MSLVWFPKIVFIYVTMPLTFHSVNHHDYFAGYVGEGKNAEYPTC